MTYQEVLQEIARKNRTTPEEVEMEMTKAIKAAYSNPNPEIRCRLQEVPRKGCIPTPKEFITHIAKALSE